MYSFAQDNPEKWKFPLSPIHVGRQKVRELRWIDHVLTGASQSLLFSFYETLQLLHSGTTNNPIL